MTATTLPTSRPVTQDWAQDFEWLNGVHYPNGFYDSIGWYGHNGIDYGCWEGDPVEAVCDGVIEFAGDGNNHWLLTGGGNALLLRNDELGVMFEYLHLSGFDVTQGQQVRRGQVIARSGNTGISTAPHLHLGAIPIYNVNVNNGYRGRVDPTPFLYGPLNPDYAGGAAIAPQSTTPKEDTLSAAEVKQITDAIAEVKTIAANTHAGVWKGGSYNGKTYGYGILPVVVESQRRQASDAAQIKNLVSALAAVAKGEALDEAKLLAGVQAAAEAGVKAGLADGTVTVDVNVNGGAV